MPLQWREKHYGEEGARRFEVESQPSGKFRAKNWDGVRIGDYGSLEEAKKAVEDAYAQAPAADPAHPPDYRPGPQKPASEPPKPAPAHHAAHQPPHKGKR